MQIKGIGVNTAGMMTAERGTQENRNSVQLKDKMFAPGYKVTISKEGRNLSKQQTVQKETGVQSAQSDERTRRLLHQLEESQLAEKTRSGYYDELNELEKQIKVLNAAYGRMREDKVYNDPLMKEIVEQQRLLREKMQEQKDLQAEEAQKRLKEAQQIAAMQASQYQEEIDENNRDLVTLLKTIEEARKAEDEQETGGPKDGGEDASGTKNGMSDAIRNSAAGFVKSSLKREEGVEELSNMIEDSGRLFLSQANAVCQNLLKTSASIKAAIDDKSFTNGQIDEMMQGFRSEVRVKSEEAYILGSFGTQVLRDMLDARIQHIADNPLQSMQQTKDGMMQAAVNAALSEARQSSLDKTSKELEDEVEELIDKRNGIDRIVQDNEENEGEQDKTQAELLQSGEQGKGSI